ncbi:molecular chaperone DnaJ [Catellatospora coxensis]|uniref:FtsH ternary system domain-containing protein n=1 Tax=Catellatospora coxensis TaxID=310354 RepID=A0A8J3L2P5_9ACTN|nr:molecular chaperone DnaJ [Catellatospora coxensis]GIG10927.1 hypothetical protein Cco03nite_76270 [Catellatospora coxensis]
MCNPRRVRVDAARHLQEAWEAEVTRVIQRSADVTGEARLREPLDAAVGGPTLVMLEQVLAALDGWEETDGSFRHELDGGYIAYHPDTQELEIVATLSDQVTVEGTATQRTSGTVEASLEVTGVGTYYDDGWGDLTEETAQREATRNAQELLEQRRREAIDAAQHDAAQIIAADLERAADAQAHAALLQAQADRVEQLHAAARRRLTALGVQGRNLFYRALADAYREAILAYARSRGAEGVVCVERDGVLEIEFNLRG